MEENVLAKNVVIEIENLSYDYKSDDGELIARGVKDVSLTIEKGDFCS